MKTHGTYEDPAPKKNRYENWSGAGYVMLYRPNHPSAPSTGLIFEHRVVMEQKLGRQLRTGENVHHINGIRDDNHPENLEVWDTSQPAGQRVEDKVAWAKDLLSRHMSADEIVAWARSLPADGDEQLSGAVLDHA